MNFTKGKFVTIRRACVQFTSPKVGPGDLYRTGTEKDDWRLGELHWFAQAQMSFPVW